MKTIKLLTVLLAMSVPSMVFAGTILDRPVTIDFDNKTAEGNMGTARYSDDDFEFIGCGTRSELGGFSFGFCQAREAASETIVQFFTFDPALINAIRAHADYSFILFGWNDDNELTFVRNSTQSFYLPDKKTVK